MLLQQVVKHKGIQVWCNLSSCFQLFCQEGSFYLPSFVCPLAITSNHALKPQIFRPIRPHTCRKSGDNMLHEVVKHKGIPIWWKVLSCFQLISRKDHAACLHLFVLLLALTTRHCQHRASVCLVQPGADSLATTCYRRWRCTNAYKFGFGWSCCFQQMRRKDCSTFLALFVLLVLPATWNLPPWNWMQIGANLGRKTDDKFSQHVLKQ